MAIQTVDTSELREHVHQEVDLLPESDLLELSQFLDKMRQKAPQYDIEAFMESVSQVRYALRDVKGSLSDDIIAEREDRL